MATDGERLNRNWIDWELARELRGKVARKLDGKTDNPLGIGLATMSLTIVNSISNVDKFTAEQKIMIVNDVMAFMADLLSNGWTAPPKKENKN
jgi:succinate-acetate transporter protein